MGGVRRDHHDYLRILNKYLPHVYRYVNIRYMYMFVRKAESMFSVCDIVALLCRLEILPDVSEVIQVPDVSKRTIPG